MTLETSRSVGTTARKMGMATSTFAVAMGVGFFMQQREADAAFTPTQRALEQMAALSSAAHGPLMSVVSIGQDESAPNFAQLEDPDDAPRLVQPAELPELAMDSAPQALDASCEPAMIARVKDGALVELSIEACDGASALTVHHEGMMFTAMTDEEGKAILMAPALSEVAVFIAALEGGEGLVASVDVPNIAEMDRVVVQWSGSLGFEIHAMEFGATYGEPRHIWKDAPSNIANAVAASGGFLMSLGDARAAGPRLAQVYTFPASNTARGGSVALSLEIEVTASNCATDIEAQTLQRFAGEADVTILDVTLSVPGCEAIGDFMVLRNLMTDLKIQKG